MALKIHSGYDIQNGRTVETVVLELVKAHGRSVVASVTDLTDSSGGTADANGVLLGATTLTNAANVGTNLAQKVATETALGLVKDALAELFTKANEYATKLDIATVVYNGGGAATDGTIAALTVATTAAATGAQAATSNATIAEINRAVFSLSTLVNKLALATGVKKLDNSAIKTTFVSTVPAITGGVGTAADPGVTKVAFDAELVKIRTNVATIAAKLNALNAGVGNAAVVVV